MKAVTVLWLLTGFHATFCATILTHKVLERGDIANFNPVSEEIGNSENTASNSIFNSESLHAKVPTQWDCDFESGDFCNWFYGDAWRVQDGRKALVSGLGPTADHTKEDAFGRYAYYNPVNHTNHKLVSETLYAGKSEYCFRFWYYMYSPASPMTLEIYALQYGQILGPIWAKKSTSSTKWRYGTYYLAKTVDTSLIFLPTRKELDIGDIALDDLAVNEGRCPLLNMTLSTEDPSAAIASSSTSRFSTETTATTEGSTKALIPECDCGYGSHSCHFDENGKKLCICFEEYAENNGQCEECECSSSLLLGCEFIHGEKKCNCPQFQAQKDKKCVDCFCGHGGNCSFSEHLKKCNCKEGFLEDSGYCKECNCGTNGKCKLFFGSKECDCDQGFGNRNGFCEACNCGQNFNCAFTLQWNNYHKSCICPDGFQEVNQYCEEVKSTTVVEKISTEGNFATTTINPDCDCGKKSFKCFRDSNGEKTCLCHTGYAQLKGMCSGTCLSSADCRNGGACRRGEGGANFCTCRYPFTGEWCEGHSDCAKLDCEATGATCRVRGNRAECECPPWKWYNEDIGRCEGYSKLWILSVALFSISALQMIGFLCYCCIFRRREKK